MDSITISVIIAVIGCLVGVAGWFSNRDRQVSSDASQMTAVIVKLENISTGIAEIKTELNGMKSEVKELRDRVTVVEQSQKSAWKQIDEIKGGETSAK